MKIHKIILLLLFVVNGLACFAQEDSFRYRRKINDIQQEGWYTIKLPPDIFAHTDVEFRDLRLFAISGTDSTEIPYILDFKKTEIRKTDVTLPVINQSKKDGILFLGFELPSGQKVNFIRLDFRELNFFGTVKFEGSNDKKEWFEIAKDERIFSVQNNNERYENTTVDFPLTDFRYLRVSVKSDTTLTFREAFFSNQEVIEGTFDNIPLTWTVQEDKKEKKTFVNIKLDHRRPISKLHIDFSNDGDYYRSAEVAYLIDSTKTQKGWIRNYLSVHNAYVTSFNSNTFNLGSHLIKDVRIIIYNYDNSPLIVGNVTAAGAAVELRALLKPQQTYLFYGKKFSSRPSYDIDHFKEKIPATAPPLGLGPEENLATPEEKGNPLFENKFWLWGIMLAVIAVLGFFTLRMMKNS